MAVQEVRLAAAVASAVAMVASAMLAVVAMVPVAMVLVAMVSAAMVPAAMVLVAKGASATVVSACFANLTMLAVVVAMEGFVARVDFVAMVTEIVSNQIMIIDYK